MMNSEKSFLLHRLKKSIQFEMYNIEKITLHNLGPFENQSIDFTIQEGNPNVHILLGANGTGKTTILHSLGCTFDYFENNHKEHTSNKIAKRYHFFDEDEKELAKSFSHAILSKKGKNSDKIFNYGCMHCGNIHQNFDKNTSDNNVISKTGKAYGSNPLDKDLAYYKNAITSKDLSNKKLKFAAFGYSGYRFIETESVEISDKNNFNPLKLALEFNKGNAVSERHFNLSNWIVSRFSKAAIEESLGNKKIAEDYKIALNKLIESLNNLTDNEYTISIETSPWKVGIKYCGRNLEFDTLPDGLRSILSWLGDLLMRLDEIPWENKSIPITEQNIILFLDEVEVHVHPTWQYKIVPLLVNLLPNSQIFISTHSPFIVNSIDNAKVYLFEIDNCYSKMLKEPILSQTGWSISYVLENIMNAKNRFGEETTKNLLAFNSIDSEIAKNNFENEDRFRELINTLANDGEEVLSMIAPKLFRLNKITGKDFTNGKNQ